INANVAQRNNKKFKIKIVNPLKNTRSRPPPPLSPPPPLPSPPPSPPPPLSNPTREIERLDPEAENKIAQSLGLSLNMAEGTPFDEAENSLDIDMDMNSYYCQSNESNFDKFFSKK